nr:hypothetical protein [Propionicimonas sp.]
MANAVASARTQRWDLVVLWAYLVSLAAVRAGRMEERDPYWQIRAGLENLAGMPLARPDTWTWSGVEGDWYPNSPLWNILLGLAYRTGGFWGFFLLSAATITLLGVMVYLLGRRLGARPLPGLLGLLLVTAAAYPMLSARATLVVQFLLLLAVYLALRIRDLSSALRAPTLVGVVFAASLCLSALGNWIHLSFLLLSPAMAVVWAGIWLLTRELAARTRWALIIGGVLGWGLGMLLSPYGVVTGLARSRAVQEACQGLITEWSSPFDPNLSGQLAVTFAFMSAVALLLAALTTWWLVRKWRAGESVVELGAVALIGVPAAVAGLMATRFLGVSLLTLAPVAAAGATYAADRFRRRLRDWPRRDTIRAKLNDYAQGRFWRIVLTATIVLLSPGTLLLASQHGVPSEQAVAARLPSGCQLFSRPGIGGAIVLLRPDAPVWMDGRADFFGRDMLLRGYSYFGGTSDAPVPDGTTCVILDLEADATPVLRERLETSPEWRLDGREGRYELWLPVAAG